MLREIIRAVREGLREGLHPRASVVMKDEEFERPLDDLGQNIDDVEHRADAPAAEKPAHPPPAPS